MNSDDRVPISSDNAPAAIGPYSQGVAVDGWVYCSGQIPIIPADGSVAQGIKDQTRQVLENLGQVLSAASDFPHRFLIFKQQIFTMITDLTADIFARWCRDQLQNTHGSDGLTAPGLAYHTESLSGFDGIADSIDRLGNPIIGVEPGTQVIDFKQRRILAQVESLFLAMASISTCTPFGSAAASTHALAGYGTSKY